MNLFGKSLFCLSTLLLVVSANADSSIKKTVEMTQSAHGLQAWWGKEVVSAKVKIIFGGQVALDAVFTFQAHGPKARMDRADGASVYFDGTTAWIYPADAPDEMGRFHVLTWPWFIMAPFKMEGDGIYLSELDSTQVGTQSYQTLLQTFGENVGDTPDDWYRFFIDPETHLIDAMSYIVTYGKRLEEANEQASIIKYLSYENFGGTLISTNYEFWYWDHVAKEYVGEGPKGTGTVRDLEFLPKNPESFEVPEGARELKLP